MKSAIDFVRQNMVQSIVFLSLLALPWINSVRISTFLFIALGVILIVKKDLFKVNYSILGRQFFFLIFMAYYALQVAAFIFYPEKMNHAAIEQKASLLIIPLLFFILISRYQNIWSIAKYGFISGNILAALVCMVFSVNQYFQTADISVFFYHQYASAIGLSAIYFSLYLVIALIYSIGYIQEFYQFGNIKKCLLFLIAAGFFFLNLILLSSKTILVIGSILLLVMLFRQTLLSTVQKATIAMVFLLICSGVLFTNNPVSGRYKALHLDIYSASFENNNFKNFAFDGLNLRLLLWRMGYEIANENKSWLIGNGGKHFHQVLNEKIIHYNLYTGDGKKDDKGAV